MAIYGTTGGGLSPVSSTQYAGVRINGQNTLAQQVQWNFQQMVEDIQHIGDVNVYYSMGSAAGSLEVSRLVGSPGPGGGASSSGLFQPGNPCGDLAACSITLRGNKCSAGHHGNILYLGAVSVSVGGGMQAGQTAITEQIGIKFSGLVQ